MIENIHIESVDKHLNYFWVCSNPMLPHVIARELYVIDTSNDSLFRCLDDHEHLIVVAPNGDFLVLNSHPIHREVSESECPLTSTSVVAARSYSRGASGPSDDAYKTFGVDCQNYSFSDRTAVERIFSIGSNFRIIYTESRARDDRLRLVEKELPSIDWPLVIDMINAKRPGCVVRCDVHDNIKSNGKFIYSIDEVQEPASRCSIDAMNMWESNIPNTIHQLEKLWNEIHS